MAPKEQDDFLTKINTMKNRGAGRTKALMAYFNGVVLRGCDAPPPKKDISNPPSGSSGWVSRNRRRAQAQAARGSGRDEEEDEAGQRAAEELAACCNKTLRTARSTLVSASGALAHFFARVFASKCADDEAGQAEDEQ